MNIMLLNGETMPEDLGMIPSFLSVDDPRPAREQFNENYVHGGGWRPLPKMTMGNGSFKRGLDQFVLCYPGDPPLIPIAMTCLRGEMILFYDHSIVVILQSDGSFEACRMD